MGRRNGMDFNIARSDGAPGRCGRQGNDQAGSHRPVDGFQAEESPELAASAVFEDAGQVATASHLYNEAEQTFRELAAAPVSDDLKQMARVQGVQVFVVAGREARANGKDAEARNSSPTPPSNCRCWLYSLPKNKQLQKQRTYLVRAEMLTELDKFAEAKAVAQELLKETTDKQIKAGAFNTLGFIFFRNKNWQEARWQFLWVDVMYNQDKEEHAKAMYYLAEIWATLGEADWSRECLDQLLTDRAFEGSSFQRRAAQEEMERNKKKL